MELRLIRHLWGVTGDPLAHIDHWSEVGYRGLEVAVMMLNHEIISEAKRRDWSLVVQIFSDGWNYSHQVAQHVASFDEQLTQALEHGADLINCHGGEDAFSDQQAIDFFAQCQELATKAGAKVVWETHRGRAMFTPWRTKMILDAVPGLQLCADFSHWVCVCERLLNDDDATMAALLPAIAHIHARVGYAEGPQVSDPSAAQYANELAWFSSWWQRIWQTQKAAGLSESWVCPEFGPVPYLPIIPHTGMPIADLPTVCDWTANHLQSLFTKGCR